MSEWFDQEAAKNDSGQFTGAHKVRIKEAEKVVTESGAEGIKFRVAFLNRLNAEGQPKELNLETVWLTDKNGKRPDADRISALFMICGANPKKVKKYKVERYNFENGEKEMTAVPMYEELIGKVVGMFIQLQKKFPVKKINPETNSLADRSEKGIWIPNYEKERRLSFVFLRAFYGDTFKTYSEHTQNKKAKIYSELTDRYSDYEEVQMDYDSLTKYMKKKADEAGLKFSGNAFSYDNLDDSLPESSDSDSSDETVPF